MRGSAPVLHLADILSSAVTEGGLQLGEVAFLMCDLVAHVILQLDNTQNFVPPAPRPAVGRYRAQQSQWETSLHRPRAALMPQHHGQSTIR